MNTLFFRVTWLVLLASSAFQANAQHGGKAEPLRIEFQRGSSNATIKDHIRRSEEAEFVFAAREGQLVTITITSIPAKAKFKLSGGDGVSDEIKYEGTRWSAVAPSTGDYLLTVVGVPEIRQRINYTLKLVIK